MQKSRRSSGKNKKNSTAEDRSKAKITLPPFGLAEEIIGARAPIAEGLQMDGQNAANADSTSMQPGQSLDTSSAVASPPERHLVTFMLDREEYGLDISSVREIIRVGQITSIPNSPEHVRGVINLRGKVIPVLDLRRRFSLPDAAPTKNSRIMVVECGDKLLALMVDSVSQVIRIPALSVESPPADGSESTKHIDGIGKVDSHLVMLVKLPEVLKVA